MSRSSFFALQEKEVRLRNLMLEIQWRKLLLGFISCLGFNPKHTAEDKQEQMANGDISTPLCFAYALSSALAALRKQERGAWEAICWCALHAM